MTKTIETYIVDAFTDEPFKGNPAGICILESELTHELTDKQMLSIAKEMGLSETAFISQLNSTETYSIRYFSPKMEIPLCGHATLASSKVLFEKNADINKIHFITIQDLDLMILRNNENIIMEFPVYQTIPQTAPKALLNALGIDEIISSEFNQETNILLIQIESSELLQNLTPDYERLKCSHNAINGVLVTALSKRKNHDFESRYFWPWSGTNEDPVIGGTHTFLAKYWSKRLNKTIMNSFQCSQRSGFMQVELISENKLTIKSKAQIILKGEFRLS